MDLSQLAIKERRILAAHVEARQRDAELQAASLKANIQDQEDVSTFKLIQYFFSQEKAMSVCPCLALIPGRNQLRCYCLAQ